MNPLVKFVPAQEVLVPTPEVLEPAQEVLADVPPCAVILYTPSHSNQLCLHFIKLHLRKEKPLKVDQRTQYNSFTDL